MKRTILTVGDIRIDEVPNTRGGLIAGRLEAYNTKTGESAKANYQILHNKKTNKWGIMAMLIKQIAPEFAETNENVVANPDEDSIN